LNRPAPTAFHLLADNAGKRRTEIIYLLWFVASLPLQWYAITHLRYDRPNDALLLTQSLVMATGTLVLPLVFRAPEDRGQPLVRLYGFRMGVFLCIWAVLGGFIGTDPWYEVLHGHFAFNTAINPNGVPLFMLPMTISVAGPVTVSGQHFAWLNPLLDTGWFAYLSTTDAVCYHDGHRALDGAQHDEALHHVGSRHSRGSGQNAINVFQHVPQPDLRGLG